MKLWPFHRRRQPSPSDAARVLSQSGHKAYRARVRAKAREMRANMGLPPLPELEDRP